MKEIKIENSESSFRFGAGETFQSSKRVTFPASIADTKITITTYVVECDLPLLLSKDAMKKA